VRYKSPNSLNFGLEPRLYFRCSRNAFTTTSFSTNIPRLYDRMLEHLVTGHRL